jgi:hypothetical protein
MGGPFLPFCTCELPHCWNFLSISFARFNVVRPKEDAACFYFAQVVLVLALLLAPLEPEN